MIQLLLGDCLAKMKEMADRSVDFVITDPPYGIKMDKGFTGERGFRGGQGKKIPSRRYTGEWDQWTPTQEYFNEIQRISKNQIIFGGNFFTDKLPQGNHWLVWDKEMTMPTFSDCELIWTNFPRNSVKKITYNNNGLLALEKERKHPTQKPVQVLKWIIESYTEKDQIICDPFMGSGTTGVACIQTGRQFIGIEKDETYFKIAQDRIASAQLPLFI